MVKKIALILLVTIFFIAWTSNPARNTAVCTVRNEQKRPHLAPDGTGGAFIIWEDSRNGSDYDIYAQRMNEDGRSQWRRGGAPICSAIGPQQFPKLTADGNGGFIAAWFDRRNGKHYDIYAQRMNDQGRAQWSGDGVAICTVEGDQFDPIPISDGDGGAIIVWQDRRNGNDYNIHAQRVDAEGHVQWEADGTAVCALPQDQDTVRVAGDGQGGVIIVWQDRRSGNDYDIYAQRLNRQGSPLWGVNGKQVASAPHDQRLPRMITGTGGDVIITWQDKRNGTDYDIYAQRLNDSGVAQWTANGIVICKEANSQYEPSLVADGNGGAVITWQDYRKGADCTFDAFEAHNNNREPVCDEKQLNDWNIYAQHINSSGRIQWAANGVTVSTSQVDQFKPQAIPDGIGGTIITWRAADKENDHNIYAQCLDSKGKPRWNKNGVAISTAPGDQVSPLLVSDGFGGAIVAWYDKRQGNNFDIYMQKLCPSGKIGNCPKPPAATSPSPGS
jgi:hypothetical protein